MNPVGSNRFETSSHTPFYTNSCYCHCILADRTLWIPAFAEITMALRRPHKGMETGWRRELATTRVAPTTGLPEPIFRGITMALRRPHKGMETGWRRELATTRVAPTTGLPEPIFRGMTVALRRPHKGMETGWCRERATTRVAPTTGLPEPIFRGMTVGGCCFGCCIRGIMAQSQRISIRWPAY